MAATEEKVGEELITLDGQANDLLTRVEQLLEQGQTREVALRELANEQRAENTKMQRLVNVINPTEQKVRRRNKGSRDNSSRVGQERLDSVIAYMARHKDRDSTDPDGVKGEVTSKEIAEHFNWESGPTSTALRVLREPDDKGRRRIRFVGNRRTETGARTKAYAILDG